MMKRILLLSALIMGLVSTNAQTWTNVNGRWGYEWLRTKKAMQFPTGCGVPSGTASLNGGDRKMSAIYRDSCGKKTYIFEPSDSTWSEISGGAVSAIYANGINKIGDSVQLGNPLTKHTFIRTKTNRSDPTSTGLNSVYIGNVPPDSSVFVIQLQDGNGSYDRGVLYAGRNFYNNDTLLKRYGGSMQVATRVTYDSLNTKFKSASTPIYLGYGGVNVNSQLFPPDTAYVHTSPQGLGSGQAYNGELGIGGINKYNLTISGFTPEYPLSGIRISMDFARTNIFVKREIRGLGLTNYVSEWKSDQQSINSGTTELGSYINKISGYMAYGTVYPHTESPSKAKTLAVSTVDTSIGFYARPQWSISNEVKNGYGFVSDGAGDYNFFAGRSKFGGTMPSISDTMAFRVHIDSTVMVGASLTTAAFSTKYWRQYGITPANLSSKKIRGDWVQSEYSFDQNTSISGSFIEAFSSRLFLYADSIQNVSSNSIGAGLNGATIGVFLRKKATYTDTTTFVGGDTPNKAIAGLSTRIDMSDGNAATGKDNLFQGYYSSLTPTFQFGGFSKIDNAIWLNLGVGQGGATNSLTKGYQIYLNPFGSNVLNKYAIYQAGTADTSLFNGPVKLNNLTSVGSYNLLVHGSDSVAHQVTPAAMIISAGSILVLKGSTTWTPGVVAAGSSATTTLTVTGAALGDPVTVSKASGAYSNGEVYDAFVSAANTVTVRVHNVSTGSANYNTSEIYNCVLLRY